MGYPMPKIASLVAVGAFAAATLCPVGVTHAQPSDGAAALPGQVIRPKYITHVVANLDRSVAFYREGLGLEVITPPSELTASTLVHKALSVSPQARAWFATLKIPGAVLELQLIQFSGIPGTPFVQHDYDPGITRLAIQLHDLPKALERVRPQGVTIDTSTGGPVYTQRPRNDTQAIMMRDPDGFVFEFVENHGSPPPVGEPVAEGSNLFNARCSLTIDNFDASLPFYRDLLGFQIGRPPTPVSDAVLALEGTPQASVRSAQTFPPGGKNQWMLWEYRGIERVKHVPNVQDPGASASHFASGGPGRTVHTPASRRRDRGHSRRGTDPPKRWTPGRAGSQPGWAVDRTLRAVQFQFLGIKSLILNSFAAHMRAAAIVLVAAMQVCTAAPASPPGARASGVADR